MDPQLGLLSVWSFSLRHCGFLQFPLNFQKLPLVSHPKCIPTSCSLLLEQALDNNPDSHGHTAKSCFSFGQWRFWASDLFSLLIEFVSAQCRLQITWPSACFTALFAGLPFGFVCSGFPDKPAFISSLVWTQIFYLFLKLPVRVCILWGSTELLKMKHCSIQELNRFPLLSKWNSTFCWLSLKIKKKKKTAAGRARA